MKINIHPSEGNVFRDLGFDATESEDLRLRSNVMIELQKRVAALGQSQAKVARILGVTQPRVSNLVQGRLDLFSLDTMVEMLDRLGNTVEVTVRAKSSERRTIETCSPTEVTKAWTAACQAFGITFSDLHVGVRRADSNQTVVSARYALAA